jgi:hypothetical protein
MSLASLRTRQNQNWAFRDSIVCAASDVYFQYPAIMVPALQAQLLERLIELNPDARLVFDPFAGSGTVLSQTLLRGLDFVGWDVNPLATLICLVKGGPFYASSLRTRVTETMSVVKRDRGRSLETGLDSVDKWFSPRVQVALSRIRRGIRRERFLWARRFMWVAMAETVRLTSNSRTSTYKLHIRPAADIETRPDPIKVFESVLERNLKMFEDHRDLLLQAGKLSSGRYIGNVTNVLGDARNLRLSRKADIVITSPPYGDNKTTVPYGQAAYLPLHWIDLFDVHPVAEWDYLVSTHEIDSRSLGGSRSISVSEIDALTKQSPALGEFLDRFPDRASARKREVAAFFKDLREAVGAITRSTKREGYVVWTVGNRKVMGRRVPMNLAITDFMTSMRFSLVDAATRTIPAGRKRMPRRNSTDLTINRESILMFKGSGHGSN